MLAGFLDRADRLVQRLAEALVVAVLVSLVVICFVEVVLRYGFGRSLGWYDEFAGYLLVWLTFLGSAVAQRGERHVGVEILGRRWMKLLRHFLLMGVQVVLLYYGALLALRFLGERAISLPVPMGLLYAAIPFSALLFLIVQARQVARLLR